MRELCVQGVTDGVESSFTGKLVRRQYKRGQPYVQLVFKTSRGAQLSLSRKASTVRAVKVGERYRVAGPMYQLGEKSCIYEPVVTPAPQPFLRPGKRLAAISIAIFLVMLSGTVLAARHFAANNTVQAETASSNAPQTSVRSDSSVLAAADQATTTTPADAAAPTTPSPAPKAAAKPTATRTTTPPATQQNTTPPAPQVTPPAQPQTPTPDPQPADPNPPVTDPEAPPAEDPPVTPPPAEDSPVIPPAEDPVTP